MAEGEHFIVVAQMTSGRVIPGGGHGRYDGCSAGASECQATDLRRPSWSSRYSDWAQGALDSLGLVLSGEREAVEVVQVSETGTYLTR